MMDNDHSMLVCCKRMKRMRNNSKRNFRKFKTFKMQITTLCLKEILRLSGNKLMTLLMNLSIRSISQLPSLKNYILTTHFLNLGDRAKSYS